MTRAMNTQQYTRATRLKWLQKNIKSVKLSNFTEICSLTNETKYEIDNLTQKYLLYKQFVAWSCNDCSTAPMTDYINSPIYQELIEEEDYFENKSNERIFRPQGKLMVHKQSRKV